MLVDSDHPENEEKVDTYLFSRSLTHEQVESENILNLGFCKFPKAKRTDLSEKKCHQSFTSVWCSVLKHFENIETTNQKFVFWFFFFPFSFTKIFLFAYNLPNLR